MKAFRAFIVKEFHHIFRDKRTLMVLFGMPIAQIILFGFAITTEIQNANIAVLDRSKDVRSLELTRSILSSGYFTLNADVQSYDDIERAFRRGEIKVALVFPPDYAAKLQRGTADLQVLTDATDPNMASTLVSYVNAIVAPRGAASSAPGIRIEPVMHYNQNQASVNMFVPGVITIVMLLVSAMLTSIALTREKELGNMEILLVSPLKPAIIILGKVIPYLVLSMVNVSTVIAVGYFLFEVPMEGSWLVLALECLLFVTCALSLGVLISTIAPTQQVALMLSLMALMMPTILLSNFIFPISSMPLPLQIISNIIPAKYFITIIKGVMLKGVDFSILWKETAVLGGMTLFFIGVSVRKFRIRL